MKNEIIDLCKQIKENIKCLGCSGKSYNHGCCIYCGKENDTINELYTHLIELLNVNIDKDILLSLNSIRFINSEVIDSILEKYTFDTYLINEFNNINEKIKNDTITNEDCKIIIYFIDNDLYDDSNFLYLTNLLMKKLILNQIELSIDDQFTLIKYFTECNMKSMHKYVKNPKCVFENLNENIAGDAFYNKIR